MIKARYPFIDPGAIMGVVVSLIILAVGVFAFFVTLEEVQSATESSTTNNTSAVGNIIATGDSVFSIMGVVLIIGAIMAIVGLVYNFVGGSSYSGGSSSIDDDDDDDYSFPSYEPMTTSIPTKTKTVETKPTTTEKTTTSTPSISDVRKRIRKRDFFGRDEWQ